MPREANHHGTRSILGSEEGATWVPERRSTMAHGRFWVPGRGAKWVPREANQHGTRPILGSGEGAEWVHREANRHGTRPILGSGEGAK